MRARSLLAVCSMPIFLAGCNPQILAIEVLPPRTSATCAAPAANSAALGRGLLDVAATETVRGAYVADLRLTARADVLVDGLKLSFALPEDASGDSDGEADDAAGIIPLGDVLLVGEEDDVRTAVVENVELLPRGLAKALRDDGDLGLSAIEVATVVVEMRAVDGETELAPDASTFAIDVCEGCLVTRPAEEDCDDGVVENAVCRPGQDEALFKCASGGTGGF